MEHGLNGLDTDLMELIGHGFKGFFKSVSNPFNPCSI